MGLKELIEKVEGGWTDFDVAVASPEAMKAGVAKLGRVLGLAIRCRLPRLAQ